MPQSLRQIYVHLVFSTKHREPFLLDPAIREETHAYLVGACRNWNCPSLQVGGVADHVHVLCRLSRSVTISDLVRELKRGSSKWLKERWPQFSSFYWQNGYGAFSISPGHVEALCGYIANQERHHQNESFQEEFLRLLKLHSLEYDTRYVWD